MVAPLHDESALAWQEMVQKLDYHTLTVRGKTVLFENFYVAAIVIGIIAGALLLSIIYYYCFMVAALGKDAFRSHTIVEGYDVRTVYFQSEEGRRAVQISQPRLREEKRHTRTSWIHLVAIIGYWTIILFGFYSAFQVCGIDPAILIALGAGTLLFSYGLAPLITETRDAIRVFWQRRFREGDHLLIYANHVAGQVKWMGTDHFQMETVDAEGDLIEIQMGYTTALSGGLQRWITGGAKHTMGKVYKDWLAIQQQMAAAQQGIPFHPVQANPLLGTTAPPAATPPPGKPGPKKFF